MKDIVPNRPLKVEEIKVVCSYCECYIRGPKDSAFVSHGICDPCFGAEMKKISESTGIPLDKLKEDWC